MHRRAARSWAAAAPLGQQLAARRRPLSGSALEKSVAGVSSMLAQQDRMSVIQAHDKYGFTVNGIHMRGSVLVFPNYTLLWSPTRLVDVCPRNTAVVHMVRPKVELLLLGTGVGENVNPSMYAYFQRRGISVEPMSTVRAWRHGGRAWRAAARAHTRQIHQRVLAPRFTLGARPSARYRPRAPADARDRHVQHARRRGPPRGGRARQPHARVAG